MNKIPASDSLLQALAAAQAQYDLFSPAQGTPQPVVVAVSGGADSVCLLHALARMADAWGLALHVAHIDHRLRPESAAEGQFVAGLAAQYGLPLHMTALDPAALRADRRGLEAAARHARYTFLCAVARTVAQAVTPAVTPAGAVPCVAVAHHADDQAETVLLRLAQGSGLAGLAALRPVSAAPLPLLPGEQPVRLVRPLLGVTRADIVAWLRRHGLPWREDASNADLRFARNRLRQVVLPALAHINPAIVATLCRSAELWAEEAERLAALDAAALTRLALTPPDAHRVVLDLAAWQRLPPADRRGVLRAALARLGADARQLGTAHLDAIVQQTAPAGDSRQRPSGQRPGESSLRSSGPHPLPGGLVWSVIGAAAHAPARLCLHLAEAPPVAVDIPQLDAAWRQAQPATPLPLPGEIVAGVWRLAATLLPAARLPSDWQAAGDPWRLYADADALGAAALAAPGPGMRIAPLGMAGQHRRVVAVLRGHKVPPSLRKSWPLLVDCRDGQVLWVCGLQPAERLRITEQTQQVVLLQWSKEAAKDSCQRFMPKIDVKPLTHWAIYKGYKLRFRSRTPECVAGVLTDAGGAATDFAYAPAALTLQVGGETIRINEYGWELERKPAREQPRMSNPE